MHSNDPVTSMTMIEKAKSGDDEAWARLTNTYGPLVHTQCIRKGLQLADAKDVTTEVFTSIFESLNKFKKDRASDRFLHFLRTITTRRIADHLRKEARRPDKAKGGEMEWLNQPQAAEQPELTDEQQESIWSFEELLSTLEAQIWREAKKKYGENNTFQAFEMKEVKGMSVDVIAKELGISGTAVRTYASRVKMWIQEQVANLPDETSIVPLDSSLGDFPESD